MSTLQREEVSVYLGLGANLGDARQAVQNASSELAKVAQTHWVACSPLYQSAPVHANGPDFVNAVVHLRTRLNAIDLLHACQAIENKAGRERPYPNAPRTLDIDLLLFGEARVQSQELSIPHPRMRERGFVLLPLRDVAPHLVSAADLHHVRFQTVRQINSTNN
jgi:2-amino-4-hydroxy-6-hydroxymethyldihydropteridine diphosphokinase